MKRSPELQKTLSENVSELTREKRIPSDKEAKDFIFRSREIIKNRNLWDNEDWDACMAEVKNNLERNRKLLTILETLIHKTDFLSSNLEPLSDEEFDQRYHEISLLLEDFNQIERSVYRASFTLSFVDISLVKNFEQFIKGRWPMQFIPHKKEIGRILALAKEAHDIRAGINKATSSDPIKIVDIGGSNGALGKLVIDLARKNGLKVEYIVIDPDTTTVQAGSEFYHDEPLLKFVPQSAEEYVISLYANNPEIKSLIELRQKHIRAGEQKIKELKIYLEKISSDFYKLEEPSEQQKAIEKHCRILREDFSIELNPTSFPTYADFIIFFEVDYIWEDDELIDSIPYEQNYRNTVLQTNIDELTKQINALLAQIPPTIDLTINSWMPPRIDFTAEIQFANSTAILYALERGGSTGCQSSAAFPEKPKRLGDGESYRQGDNYRSIFGWKSHSVPQLRQMSDGRRRDIPFTERMIDREQDVRGVEHTFPFSNAFIVQTRKNVTIDNIEPDNLEIATGEVYPWEQELDERGGVTQPIRSIADKNGVPDLETLID